MSANTKILTIPTQISPIHPDKNGRIFHKETMDVVFKRRGYFRPNPADRITITPIPIRFFIDVTDYCQIMCCGFNHDRQLLNTDKFTVNADISDEELAAFQMMYTNDRYYLNIPISKEAYEKHADYFSKCQAHAICSELHAVEDVQMGAEDILYFDVFPEK